ncbi:hypothetical protein SL1157_3174 [Ruegeria lacuscaerulensis ITI-1157]|nr:hypothetical protein SL1157_3174 [Ruegeria lacuscaerulensis ITI-1157]
MSARDDFCGWRINLGFCLGSAGHTEAPPSDWISCGSQLPDLWAVSIQFLPCRDNTESGKERNKLP